MNLLLSALAFAAVLLAGWALFLSVRQRRLARQALAGRLAAVVGPVLEIAPAALLKDPRLSRIPALDAALRRTPLVLPLVRMIRQAGLQRRLGEVLLYVPLLACTGYLLVRLAGGAGVLGLVVAGALGLLPLAVVASLRRQRTTRFAEQLPDALDLIRAALQAGHGLQSAFGVVADTFADPVAQEFRYVVEELRLGLPMREALYNLATRVGDPNVPILIVGVLVAQEVGGNLAEVTDNIAHTIRERAKLARQTRVMTAQGRLSGALLTSLPFLVSLFMYAVTPTYFAPLIETRTGHYMIAYALVSILWGHLVIRRLVQVKV